MVPKVSMTTANAFNSLVSSMAKPANETKTETKTKVENYSPEVTANLLADYAAGSGLTVEALADKYARTTRSIIAKLSRSGVYVKKTVQGVRKDGTPVQKKDTLADSIGAVLRLNENDIESLTKCTRTALMAIFKALAESKPIEGTETAKAE